VVHQQRGQGKRIVLAEMNDGTYNRHQCHLFTRTLLTARAGFITKKDLSSDGIHPTNDGYKKMAAVWLAAILEAREANMLQKPEDNGQEDDRPTINADRPIITARHFLA